MATYETRFVKLADGRTVESIVRELLLELSLFPQWARDMGFKGEPIVYLYKKECQELTPAGNIEVDGVSYPCYEVPCKARLDGSVQVGYVLPAIDPPGIFGAS